MRGQSHELGALLSKLQLGDGAMSIETYIQMEGEEIIELELSTDELVDAALGINHAQGFDLNVDLHIAYIFVFPRQHDNFRPFVILMRR